ALLGRQNRLVGRVALGVAMVLVFLMGFGLVWLREQRLSEVLLECAAGAVVLFAGVWWLEGPRLGVAEVRAADAPVPATGPRGPPGRAVYNSLSDGRRAAAFPRAQWSAGE